MFLQQFSSWRWLKHPQGSPFNWSLGSLQKGIEEFCNTMRILCGRSPGTLWPSAPCACCRGFIDAAAKSFAAANLLFAHSFTDAWEVRSGTQMVMKRSVCLTPHHFIRRAREMNRGDPERRDQSLGWGFFLFCFFQAKYLYYPEDNKCPYLQKQSSEDQNINQRRISLQGPYRAKNSLFEGLSALFFVYFGSLCYGKRWSLQKKVEVSCIFEGDTCGLEDKKGTDDLNSFFFFLMIWILIEPSRSGVVWHLTDHQWQVQKRRG